MSKKFLSLIFLPLCLAGCATTATFTNLTPQQQIRNPDNLYQVEVAMESNQQSLRWDSIRPQIMVGTEYYKMRPTLRMKNRWEGLIPVSPGASVVRYRYKFDFDYNAMGKPKPDSALSQEYTLKVVDAPKSADSK